MPETPLSNEDWLALARDPQFRNLVRAQRTCTLPLVALVVLAFLALPIAVAFAPQQMASPVHGALTLGFALGLALFVVAACVLTIYLLTVPRLDGAARAFAEDARQKIGKP